MLESRDESELDEAIRSLPLTNEFRMDMARLEIPVSGCTCLRTVDDASVMVQSERIG
jgi:hypothetical protein